MEGYAAPQLHTHAVIFNLTEREDGKTRALQPQSFFDSQQFATAVYQSELTFQLRDLGYELTTGRSGAPEIAGYTQEYLDASSPRRQQIEEALAASGFRGAAAAQIVAHNSRDSKRILTPEKVLAAHRAIADQFGNQAEKVVAAAQSQAQRQVPDAPRQAQQAVSYAIHGLQGLAGTGKTTTLESIREGAEKRGYVVEGFAPTSRAAGQLRDAKIDAGTLQGFLAKHQANDPEKKHLYMVDESSLASTRQMRDFLEKIGPQDRVLLIGDTSQHQGVDAGKPFEQMQAAGMQTSLLDKIMRQKDPELLRAVEHLSKNETEQGIKLLSDQGRITQIVDPVQRIDAIARDYARQPENTLVVSPDNKSRQQINEAIRTELQAAGSVSRENHTVATLTQRSDMTGADRTWAGKYNVGDILQYTTGSKEHGINRGSYATVQAVNQKENQLTVRRADGQSVTYDPKRLQGISAFRETSRAFSEGDRVQFTGINRDLGVSNRDLGTITKIEGTQLSVKMDGDNRPGPGGRGNRLASSRNS